MRVSTSAVIAHLVGKVMQDWYESRRVSESCRENCGLSSLRGCFPVRIKLFWHELRENARHGGVVS
jgi:hypothetical protein